MLVPLIVACAFFMEQLDGTVIATALPQMARSFHTNVVDLSVGMTAYLLTLGVFIPVSGWVADRFGARNVFCAAIVVFALASIACGVANGIEMFVLARIVQGIGGAMMVPVGRVVVLRTSEKRDLMRAIAYITWPGLVAPVIGPPVGGFITTFASWRWIFFLNVPIALVGIVLVLRYFANDHATARRPFDSAGFVFSAVAISSLMQLLDVLARSPIDGRFAAILFLMFAFNGTLAVRHARSHPQPLVSLAALRIRTFETGAISGALLFRSMLGTAPFLLPLMFQEGFGLSAFLFGLYLFAFAGGNLGMKTVTTRLLRGFGFRNVLIVNGALCAATMFACGQLAASFSPLVIALVVFAAGAARSLQFTGINTLSFVDVPKAEMSAASTLSSTVQQLSFGLGIALGALVLHASVTLRAGARAAFAPADFRVAFTVVSFVLLLSVLPFLRIPPDAGAEVSGHKPPVAA